MTHPAVLARIHELLDRLDRLRRRREAATRHLDPTTAEWSVPETGRPAAEEPPSDPSPPPDPFRALFGPDRR